MRATQPKKPVHAMTNFELIMHVAPKVILITAPACIAFVFLERYVERRKARNEGVFRDDRRQNDWR